MAALGPGWNEGGVYPCYVSKSRGSCREDLLPLYLPPWLRNLASATGQRKGQAIPQAKLIGLFSPQGSNELQPRGELRKGDTRAVVESLVWRGSVVTGKRNSSDMGSVL